MKLEDKSQGCILLGCGGNCNGYKRYNFVTRELVMSVQMNLTLMTLQFSHIHVSINV